MDRVFKRVSEGVLAFDAIYDKVQESTNQSQKEKLEQDLKREIKKLQRLRDQIKTWMGSNEIKDKKALTEQRKLIESEMERFKACEKEMKTKAYSKEGLTNSAKTDPRTKEKQITSNFISAQIEELDRQIESMEAEQENIQSTMKKGKKDTAKAERISDIEHHIERHKWHQGKMETILRMVENGSLAPESVNSLQEDIKYYVESNQDADFAEDEELYEELNLDDDEEDLEAGDDVLSVGGDGNSLEDLAVDSSVANNNKDATASSVSTPTKTKSSASISSMNSTNNNNSNVTPAATSNVSVATTTATSTTASSNNVPPQPASPVTTNNSMKPAPVPSRGDLKYASAAASSHSTSVSTLQQQQSASSIPAGLSPLPPPPKPTAPPANNTSSTTTPPEPPSTTPTPTAATTTTNTKPPPSAPSAPWAEKLDSLKKASTSLEEGRPDATNSSNAAAAATAALVHFAFPPGLQDLVNSFDAARKRIGTPPPISSITKLLESAYLNCPDATLADKPRYYHPQSPFPTPSCYPHDPLPGIDDPLILAKMDVDTLFYIFYYRQGTYQQYLAAKELKNRSWRFHKRFLTWFQRHEEPKVINNEYEQGTYRYFDFEGLWLQRRKSNFKFEYKFLEDDI